MVTPNTHTARMALTHEQKSVGGGVVEEQKANCKRDDTDEEFEKHRAPSFLGDAKGARAAAQRIVLVWWRGASDAQAFRKTQFDIERMFWTTTVFSGSSHSPPSVFVVANNICSSTRKRSLPSGR